MTSVVAASALIALPGSSTDPQAVLTWLSEEVRAERVLIPNRACEEAEALGEPRIGGWIAGARALRTRKDGDAKAQRWVLSKCPELVDPEGDESCLLYVAAMAYELKRSNQQVRVITEDRGVMSPLTPALDTLGISWQRLRPWLDTNKQP